MRLVPAARRTTPGLARQQALPDAPEHPDRHTATTVFQTELALEGDRRRARRGTPCPGSRLAARLGLATGRNVLLRLVRGLPDPQIGTVAVLGVDDFAIRRTAATARF